jgi:Nuclease-related domain
LIGTGGVVLALHFVELSRRRKRPPRPLSCDTLRGPGHTHSARIDELDQAIGICRIGLMGVPVVAILAYAAYARLDHAPDSWLRVAIPAGILCLALGYYLWRLLRLLAERRLCRLIVEGEVAVGSELNLLLADGYRVFHDFPADAFKIDHIVIGTTGVMAVATRARECHRRVDAVVSYDGRMLHFPKFSDYETIDQAKSQAEWLSQWLSATVGEDICARAMVALPGWSVKRTSADGIPAVNPKQFANLFRYIKPRPLSAEVMQRIFRQIEGRCRDMAG